MSKLKKIIIGVVTVMLFNCLFIGCGSTNGTFYTLNETYEDGLITRENMMNIAALRTGSVKTILNTAKSPWEFEEVDFTAVEPSSPLDNALKKKIVKDFKASKKDKMAECEIFGYYGTYGDYIAVEIRIRYVDIEFPAVMRELSVDNIYLGSISYSNELLLWHKN